MSESRAQAPQLPQVPSVPPGDYPDPIPGILPFGTVNLFAGAPGSGKTILLADWCARLRDGRTICRYPTRPPTNFHYLAADRGWDTFAAAFRHAGFSEIPHYCLADDHTMDPRVWRAASAFALFQQCLDKLNPDPGALVIVDPVSPLFIAGDQNRPRDVAVSLHWFRRIAQARQITLLCCMNVAKPKVEPDVRRVRDRASGSLAFGAYCDTQISLDVDEDNVRLLTWSPRMAEEQSFRLVFNQESRLFIPAESAMGLQDDCPDPTRDRPTQLLTYFPTDDPISYEDLCRLAAERLQISAPTLRRDLGTLLERGLIERAAHGVYRRRKLS